MMRLTALLALGLALLVAGADERTVVGPAGGDGRTEVVVVLASPPLAHAPAGGAEIAAEQRAFRRELAARLPEARMRWRYRLVANGFSVALPESQVARLRELPGVREVFDSTEYGPQLEATPEEIGAPALWGSALATSGQGIKIGIIDSGVDPRHPFFDPTGYSMPRGFPRGQRNLTTAKVIVARSFPPAGARKRSTRLAFDSSDASHGTHVAGIAAGNARTRVGGSTTVSGVAPRAYIGNYKVFVATDSGLSPNANAPSIVAAIEAAVADGMDVVNFSGGEPEIEPARDVVALALDAAAAAGVVPVVSAGNDYNDVGAGSVSSPANSAAAISVGAVEIDGTPPRRVHADFSSVGPTTISLRLKPDVAAPGVGVLSSVTGGGFSRFSGTSMAAPHVAGAAALLRQRHPGWTVAQIKSALVQTGVDATGEDGALPPQFQGGGVVSLGAADTPLLFAQPASVSFGLLGRGASTSGVVSLSDAGGGAGTWTATLAAVAPDGVSVAFGPTVEVPGELPYDVTVSTAAQPGELSGYLVLRRAGATRRIPLWGRITAAALTRHRTLALPRPGVYRGGTRSRPALVSRYRYPEDPSGIGVRTVLAGPEAVYRVQITKRVANFGVVVTSRTRGTLVEPRVVAGLDENRLTGYASLPVAHNPYLDGFREPVLAAGALAPEPGEYAVVFDSASRTTAGGFTFRFWINDVTPPSLRLVTRGVRLGRPILVTATDTGSGVYRRGIVATIGGRQIPATFSRGVVRVDTRDLPRGRYRLRLRVSDHQETKNTENVARILPNTRTLTATVTIR